MSTPQHSRSVPAEPALWATQYGGLAELRGTAYIWFELPQGYEHEYELHQPVPKQWGFAPANEAAVRVEELFDRIHQVAGHRWDDDGGLHVDAGADAVPRVISYEGWDGT